MKKDGKMIKISVWTIFQKQHADHTDLQTKKRTSPCSTICHDKDMQVKTSVSSCSVTFLLLVLEGMLFVKDGQNHGFEAYNQGGNTVSAYTQQ